MHVSRRAQVRSGGRGSDFRTLQSSHRISLNFVPLSSALAEGLVQGTQ